MATGGIPRRLNFMEKEEPSSRITPDAQGPQLPASTMDLTMDNMIDVTPSGEVQMRVTKGIYRQDESLNGDQPIEMARCRTQKEKDSNDAKITDEEQLLQDLEKHKEAERDILEKLRGFKTKDEKRFSHGRGDSSNEEYPGLRFPNTERGRLQQDDPRRSERPVQRPCIDNFPWKASFPGNDCTGDETTREANVAPFRPGEDCRISVDNRNRCVDTNTPIANTYMNRVVDSADQGYDSSRNLNRNNFDVRLNTINSVTKSQVNDQDNVKAKRPPLYDGISSWQDHLVQFEMIALKNNWSESTKAYELATSLKGDARGIVTDLEPEMRLDYKYLVAELTSRFEPANQANMYKAQMNSLFRKQGQALPELAQEIKRITRLAYPTAPIDIRDQLAKDCFIRAVNDTKIQLTLFNREPKTIGDCVRVGVEYEAFVVDQKRLTNTKPAIRMQYDTPFEQIDDEDNILGQIAKMSHQLDDMAKFRKSNDYSGVTCFYCGIKGHMKKTCRKYQNDRQNNTVQYRSSPNTQQRFNYGSQYTQGTQTDRQGN
ncbi:unnamed protein product [Mytilus edulis]|uniref:CCHC-type domain-containing protein n=1 Tax=Mytilus edulis TaxID=6550 RepID=A0A8S3QP17_MYTED|nr:unnamed protein product [Mytilus edulis]